MNPMSGWRAKLSRTGILAGAWGRLLSVAAALTLAIPGAADAEAPSGADDKRLSLGATTALQDTGFLDHILPVFTKSTGIAVAVQAQPPAAALHLAREGKVDAVLTDAYEQELEAVEDGSCVDRRDVMYSDLVLVGPRGDPAGVAGMVSIIDAAKQIATAQAPFVGRGDGSAVAATERQMWNEAEVPVGGDAAPPWYTVSQGDMAQTLALAASRNAYTLTDRPSWLRFRKRGRLQVLVQDDPRLVVQYGAMVVNPARHPGVHAVAAKSFVEWLSGKDGQAAIARFQLQDEVPYVPNYGERGH
ncbi:MAG TPA: substrate-binding domain-containing protein [Alphaproteobacteria bacterium]